jgi:hypothetical protein
MDWLSAVVGFVSGSAFGTIGGAIIAQRMIGSREARDRKNTFRGHLGRWIGALDQPQFDPAVTHAEFAPHVMGFCSQLRRDYGFLRRPRFIRQCEIVSRARPADSDYRAKIESLIKIV